MKASAMAMAAQGFSTKAHPANQKLRVCVIGDTKHGGYGHHLWAVWSLRDDAEIVAVADPNDKGRNLHMEKTKAKRGYADYREMLSKEKPDIVTIGPRWTINHREYLLACAEAGAHGFIEKPLATMFVWAEIPAPFKRMGSLEFSKFLVKEARVAVSPGIGFGEYGDGYIRFALVENEHRIRQAIKGIKQALQKA